jgi:hypothetical protein
MAGSKKEDKPKDKIFVNPFDMGVTYVQFLEAKGVEPVKDYCKGYLSDEQIEWLENDLKHFIKK